MKRRTIVSFTAALLAGTVGSGLASAQDKKALAFVTNGVAEFWKIAQRGTERAASELPNYDVQFYFYIPSDYNSAEQRRILDDLLARRVAGASISVVDPANSTEILNKVASQTALFTMDSDAPQSNRVLYIGTDNKAAGEQAGELLKTALPDGGKIIMFVGSLANANARERVDGIKKVIAGTKVEIIDVRTDDFDLTRAKGNVEDALAKYPDISGLVGLYSYNTPRIIEVIKAAGKAGKVKIIGFDEDSLTLRGIADSIVDATVVQQPYEFGYQSVKMLARYIEGDRSFIPASKLIIIPTKVIDKKNVAEFQEELNKLLRR